MDANRLQLAGRLLERQALRFTPAGVEVVEFRLAHVSERMEAGLPRRVECEMACVALGVPARIVSQLAPGQALRVVGFVGAKSAKNRNIRLHVEEIEILEGMEYGIQTEIEEHR
jgi:primosomal replication protein N